MRKYNDYKEDKSDRDLTKEEIAKIEWMKFKIIVPTDQDKEEMKEAFHYLHYLDDIDTDYIAVNQLIHQYLDDEDGGNNIIVDKELFDKLNK